MDFDRYTLGLRISESQFEKRGREFVKNLQQNLMARVISLEPTLSDREAHDCYRLL